jgi:hypothetical protein
MNSSHGLEHIVVMHVKVHQSEWDSNVLVVCDLYCLEALLADMLMGPFVCSRMYGVGRWSQSELAIYIQHQ